MTERPTDRFDLGPDADDLESVARDLEAFADETRLAPPSDLLDRIMAAVADEPVPTPPVTFLHALGDLAFLDAWRAWRLNLRVALGAGAAPGRLRLQALTVVVVAALLVGLGGATVAVGAAQLVQAIVAPSDPDPDATPQPSGPEVSPSPQPLATPEVSPSPDTSTDPDASHEPGESAEPGESESPEASSEADDSGGSSGSRTSATPRPSRTPRPTDTPEADHGDDHGDDGTPKPSDTPQPTSTSGGSGSSGSGSGSGSGGSGSDD